jgi:hypothetical protein
MRTIRTLTRRLLAGALVAAALLAVPAGAAEIPEDVDAKELKTAQERFEREFDTADIDFQLRAIRRYAGVQHPKIAKDLVKLLKHDDKHVRAAVAKGLGKQLSSAKTVGPKLLKLIDDSKDDEGLSKVTAASVGALAALHYEKADKTFKKLIHNVDDGVVASVFTAYGTWKSDAALREMLDFFKRYPDEKSFATGTVTVDTGAAGTEDAEAAKAKWKAKYGGQRGWRPRPECTQALIAALKEITGFGFRRPEDLEDYMKDPKKYVDPETIGERVEEGERQQIYAKWYAIKAKAEEIASKEVKDEKASKERAKVYRKNLYEMRDDILDKHKLRLSELDCIVEEGDEKSWPQS